MQQKTVNVKQNRYVGCVNMEVKDNNSDCIIKTAVRIGNLLVSITTKPEQSHAW